jgi:hypothetical protein
MAKKRDDVMCIRIPADEKAVIKQIADLEDNSMTDMVLFFVRRGVSAYQAEKTPSLPPTNKQVHEVVTKAVKAKAKATKAKK